MRLRRLKGDRLYYALSNNLLVMKSNNLKWLLKTLRGCYSDVGPVVIKDQTGQVVNQINLNRVNIHPNYVLPPDPILLQAANQVQGDSFVRASVGYTLRH